MKFCKFCKHYQVSTTSTPQMNLDRCLRDGKRVSLVTGQELPPKFCENERDSLLGCGREGKYWESVIEPVEAA